MKLKYWNKKIKYNLVIALVLWVIFAIVMFSGILSGPQQSFGKLFQTKDGLAMEQIIFQIISLLFQGVIMVVLINNIRPSFSLIIPFSLLAIYYIVFRFIAPSFNINLDLFFTFFYGMLVYIINIVYNFLAFDRERKAIKKAFEFYLAPEYIEQISEDPTKLALGGDNKELTVLFSDIRAFSSISEKLPVKELVSLLNQYLSAMTDIVMNNKGIVDKYIGDAVMAFWGAPIDDSDHAVGAVESALNMIEILETLNTKWKKNNWPEIKIGVGINTGEVMVGNMGSDKRFNYTVMGDNVNLASRLEGLTKYYGVKIIISQSVLEKLGGKFVVRPLDLVIVKGKKQPVKIYELCGRANDEKKFKETIQLTEDALTKYWAKDWDGAIDKFKELAHQTGQNTLSELFINRCLEFKKTPPSSDWGGAWEMQEK